MKVTDEQLQQARAKYPRAAKVTMSICGEDVEVVVRPASRQEWKMYSALVNSADENKNATAGEQLVIWCTLVPEPALLPQLLDAYPACVPTIASKIRELSGLAIRVEVDLPTRS